MDKERIDFIAKVLKTIAHPVKIEILLVLKEHQPLDVSSICEKIGASCELSMMSHHLGKMKDNGIVESNKNGKQVYYSIKNPDILNVIDCFKKCETT